MKQSRRHAKATVQGVPDTTGRDGAVDFAVKSDATSPYTAAVSSDDHDRFVTVMGSATIDLWGDLPTHIQELLFEHAVVLGHQTERDESLREQLAKFLHDNHKRTVGDRADG